MDGVTVTLGVLADPFRWLRLGATYSPAVDLDVETRTTIEDGRVGGTTTALRRDLELSQARYPSVVRAGGSARFASRWLLAADYLWQNWEDWSGRLYGAEAAATEWCLGGGIEARPHRSRKWSQLAYRAGGSYAVWAHKLGGNEISQKSVHFGLGWGLRDDLGRLDVAVEYARIGDLARNGYEENRWGFVVSLNGQEAWRRRSPRTE
jgi:hypothetical protein